MMKKYKLNELGFNAGDEENTDGISYKVKNVDSETNSVTWKVDYNPDFGRVFDKITDCLVSLNDLMVQMDNGGELRSIETLLRKTRNEYRAFVKSNYPKAYSKFKGKSLEEISNSGSSGSYLSKKFLYKLPKK